MIPMKNGLAPGVRQASDFLMALQLTGAAKTDSIANLTVRLPVVVIGGGLTAIDTATESLAYYPLQVEKFLSRYEILIAERGEEAVRAEWTPPEREIAAEFIGHAREIRAEREAAAARGPAAAPRQFDRRLGRGDDRLSPAPHRLSELHPQPRGSREGDGGGDPLTELLTPVEVEVDVFGQAAALRLTRPRRDRRDDRKRSCCQRARSWSRPEPSRTPCSAAKIRRISFSTGVISARSTRPATRRRRSGW